MSGMEGIIRYRMLLSDAKDPLANYVIDNENGLQKVQGQDGTYSRFTGTYWITRTTSTQTTDFDWINYGGGPYAIRFGTGSVGNSLQNTLGSRWQIAGGTGEYSWEIPMVDPYNTYLQQQSSPFATYNTGYDSPSGIPINYYFAWGMTGSQQTWINVNRGFYDPSTPGIYDYVTGSCTWYVNGISQKYVGLPSDARQIKIHWNKNTGLSSVYWQVGFTSYTTDGYGEIYVPGIGMVGGLIGTYSIATSSNPFCVTGFLLSSTMSLLYTENGYHRISNYQVRGITGSNYGVNNPPPQTALFGQNDKY